MTFMKEQSFALTLSILIFSLAATIVLNPAFAHPDNCIGYNKSEYGEASVSDIQRIIFEESGHTPPGRLAKYGTHYFSNPISQLLLGINSIDSGNYEAAIAHLDLASYLIWEGNLCSKKDLEFFSFSARKFTLENGFLTGIGRQMYLNMTTGLSNPSHELLSQDFQKTRQCLIGMSTAPDTGALVFSSC